MNKKLMTVTLPLEEFERLVDEHENERVYEDHDFREIAKYFDELVEDVIEGSVTMTEAHEFIFFKSKIGKFILNHLNEYIMSSV